MTHAPLPGAGPQKQIPIRRIDDMLSDMGRQRRSTADSTAATERNKPSRLPWLIILAERGPDGEWRTVEEPLPNVEFVDVEIAYDYAMKKNRSWNRASDWADDPSLAWVAVRSDSLGRLRSHKPTGTAPLARLPVGEEPKTGLAPARTGRPPKWDEDVHDHAEDADDQDEAGQLMVAPG
ncbi:MAG: hypothetical protein ACKV19_27040 [Verrucomicrobiales bacterium]